jgi:hypothetical protein
VHESLNGLLFDQIKSELVIEQWDETRRVASSIRYRTVSASLLMRKLAAYPRQNQVARVLTEMGKLERTAYLLEYFRNEALRRRVLIGLNKGEALHALVRQLFFGRLGVDTRTDRRKKNGSQVVVTLHVQMHHILKCLKYSLLYHQHTPGGVDKIERSSSLTESCLTGGTLLVFIHTPTLIR